MWIKICGIRDVETARQIAALGPDAIGLNFYQSSPRCVSPEVARQITEQLPATVEAVGVFVNHAVDDVVDLVTTCRLTMLQLHGDESPEFVVGLQAKLPAIPLIRAWRMGTDLADLDVYLASCQRMRVRLAACLIDAKVTGNYGGTGHTPPWDSLRTAYQREQWPPLILAGGLTEANVAAGIHVVQPWGVDVASGVESAPGVKDLDRVQKFLTAARQVEKQ